MKIFTKIENFRNWWYHALQTHLKQFFYQTTQDAAPSAKIAAIRSNKFELQSNLCYQNSIFPLVFQTMPKGFHMRKCFKHTKPQYFLNVHSVIFPTVHDKYIFNLRIKLNNFFTRRGLVVHFEGLIPWILSLKSWALVLKKYRNFFPTQHEILLTYKRCDKSSCDNIMKTFL